MGLAACDTSASFERTNPRDPDGISYRVEAPGDLAAALTDEGVHLTWTDVNLAEDGYVVTRRPDGERFYDEIARLPADSTSYVDAEPPGFVLDYRVLAYLERGEQRVEAGPVSVDASPTDLDVEIVDEMIARLSWTDGGPFEEGYVIERVYLSAGHIEPDAVFEVGKDVINYEDTTFACGGRHTVRYRVRARMGDVYSAPIRRDRRCGLPEPRLRLRTPHPDRASLRIELWGGRADLVRGFRIYRRLEEEPSFRRVAELPGDARSYVDETLPQAAARASYYAETLTGPPSDVLVLERTDVLYAADTLAVLPGRGRHVAMSPDSALVAVAYAPRTDFHDERLEVRDAASGEILWSRASGMVVDLAFDAGGHRLYALEGRRFVVARDARSGQELERFGLPRSDESIGGVESFDLAADAPVLAVAGREDDGKAVYWWDLDTGVTGRPSAGGWSSNEAVAVHPSGGELAVIGGDTVHIRALPSGRLQKSSSISCCFSAGHPQIFHALAYSPDGERLMIQSDYRPTTIIDLEPSGRIVTLPAQNPQFVRGGRLVATGARGTNNSAPIRVWDAATGEEVLRSSHAVAGDYGASAGASLFVGTLNGPDTYPLAMLSPRSVWVTASDNDL